MRNLYVVTHPEAAHHHDGLVGGWFDSDLTEQGLATAHRLGGALLERLPPGAQARIYTSDLRRTTQTAEAINEHLRVGLTTTPDLREQSFGTAGGRPQAWLDARYVPPPAHGDRMTHVQWDVDGVETRLDVATRVFRAVDRILADAVSHQVIVTHGFAATFVLARWIGMPLEACGSVAFPVGSGTITRLREDDHFRNRAVMSLGQAPD